MFLLLWELSIIINIMSTIIIIIGIKISIDPIIFIIVVVAVVSCYDSKRCEIISPSLIYLFIHSPQAKPAVEGLLARGGGSRKRVCKPEKDK